MQKTSLPFDAYNGQEPFVFVSYAHKDGPTIFAELAWLRLKGYRIWYDEGIDPGNEWPDEIAKALDTSSLFLVFISNNSVGSQNVRNEINYALNKNKKFLAVHIEETSLPPGLELRMGDIQAIMKWRMDNDLYRRKLCKSLPVDLLCLADTRESSELDKWVAEAENTLIRFKWLYESMRWQQYKKQRSVDSFLDELRSLVAQLPPLPSPSLGTPSPIHRQGLLGRLQEYISGDIHTGKPIPDSYRLEPVVSELAIRPGITSVCFSRREGFGDLPEGEIVPMIYSRF